MGRFMSDKGLLERIGQMGVTVRDRTSDLVVNAMGFFGRALSARRQFGRNGL